MPNKRAKRAPKKPHAIGPVRPQPRKNQQGGRPVRIGSKLIGYGDYTEAKGRALYDKKKNKKKARRAAGGSKSGDVDWWDMAGKAASFIGPLAIKALAGFGDYSVDTNSVAAAATEGKLGGDIPLLANSHCANIVHHREYIGPVNGSTKPFEIVAQYPINPGMLNSFPWSNPIAACYTRYRMRGIVYEYEPLTSELAMGSLGYVALATQYNPLDPDFTDKRTMLNHEFSSAEKPSRVIVHPVECAKNQMSIDEYFIRDGPPPSNADLRFYDLGKLTVAAGGNPTATQVGDLWATYELEFYQPKMNLGMGDPVFGYDATNMSNTEPFGSDGLASFGNMSGSVVTPTSYAFPAAISNGLYEFVYSRTGTVTTIDILEDMFTFENCSLQSTNLYPRASNGTSAISFIATYLIKVTASPAKIIASNLHWTVPEGPGTFTLNKMSADILKPLVLASTTNSLKKLSSFHREEYLKEPIDSYDDSSHEDRLEVVENSLRALTINLERITALLLKNGPPTASIK